VNYIKSCLSLILPSCMVVPSSELVNISFFVNLHTYITPIILNYNQIDMEVDTLRKISLLSSINGLREILAHSSISSIFYIERMKAQSNDLL